MNALLVEHNEFLRNLGDRFTNPGLAFLPFAATKATQAWRIPAGEGTNRINLIARNIEAIVAAVFQKQIVAFDTTNRTFHHAAVTTDAVLVVHDEVSGREVIEVPLRNCFARSRASMGTPTTRDIGFCKQRQADLWQPNAALKRRNNNVAARCGEVLEPTLIE